MSDTIYTLSEDQKKHLPPMKVFLLHSTEKDDYDIIFGIFSTHQKALNQKLRLKDIGHSPEIIEVELDQDYHSINLYKKLYFQNES